MFLKEFPNGHLNEFLEYYENFINDEFNKYKDQQLKLEYQDLLYFGYDWSEDGNNNKQSEIDFKIQIKERFPNVKLVDAYDSIKGYRQEVYLEKTESDNYFSWLIGKQWYQESFTMQMLMMSGKSKEKESFDKYLKLAKQQYPEVFKPEALVS